MKQKILSTTIQVILLMICYQSNGQNYAEFNMADKVPISIEISLEDGGNIFKKSMEHVYPTFKMKVKNKTEKDIYISNRIRLDSYFLPLTYFKQKKIERSFLVEQYDTTLQDWDVWSQPQSNNKMIDVGFADLDSITHKIMPYKIGEIEMPFFVYLDPGKYRIKILLGTKITEDAFLTISSNALEFTVVE